MWLNFTRTVILTSILLFISLLCNGQDGFLFPQKETKPAIIYYNFYNGIQIIKVDMLNYSRMRVAQMPPRALPPEMILQTMPTYNSYLIRDASGTILRRYCPYAFDEGQLLPPGKVKTIPHSLNPSSGIIKTPQGVMEPEDKLKSGVYKIYDNNKKGLMDTLGNILLEPKFERLQYLDSMYLVTLNGLHGVYSDDYKVLLPTKYKIFEYKGNGLFFGYKDGHYLFIERNGTVRRKMDYDDIDPVSYPVRDTGHYIYSKGGKLGLLDSLYNEATPPAYDGIIHHDDGFSGMNSEGLWALMDNNGKRLTDFKYTEVLNFEKGYARLAIIDRSGMNILGIVGNDGIEISGFAYNEITPFSSTHFRVSYNHKYGLMDRNGKVTVDMIYNSIEKVDDYIVAELSGVYGLIDANGKGLLPFKYHSISRVYNGFAQVNSDNKQALVNLSTKKEYIFPCDYIVWFESNLVCIYHDRKQGVLTLDGKVIIPIEYQQVGSITNGLIQLVQNNKYGYANASGKIIIPIIYDEAYNWAERPTIIASLSGKWGSLDFRGNVLVPFEYDNAHFTGKGNMKFSKAEDTFLFDPKGKFIAGE